MYKTYCLDIRNAMEKRTGTDGYQPKFFVDNGENFLKVQCKLSNMFVNDWRVEDIASRICEQLGFYAVKQVPCYVKLNTVPQRLYGVLSKNFEKDGLQFFSFEKLLNLNSESLRENYEYNILSAVDKMKWMSKKVKEITQNQVSYDAFLKYLIQLSIVDILVCNVDRHPRNFGCCFNMKKGRFEVAPMFDFGMGLFENDVWFRNFKTFEECLNYCYIEPYSEDPLNLLIELNKHFNIYDYFKSKNVRLQINKDLFPSKKSYDYFKVVTQRMGV